MNILDKKYYLKFKKQICTHNKLLEEEVSYFRIQAEVTVHLHNRDIIVVVASPNMQYSNNS